MHVRQLRDRRSDVRFVGFSLVELMIAVLGIIALSALLVPLLHARSMALMTACIKRQQQLYQGVTAYESLGQPFTIHQNWHLTLLEFLEDEQKVFICPEEGEFNPVPLLEAQVKVRTVSGEIYYLNIFEGPFGRRLSETQYTQAMATYGDFPDSGAPSPWAPFFDGSGPYIYTGYVPDSSDSYYMMMEDIQQNGLPGGDQDFDDLIFKITPTRLGYVMVEPMKGTTGYTQSLVDYYDNEVVYIDDIQFEETRSTEVGVANADYGLNTRYRKSIPDSRIVLMDFERSLLDPAQSWQQYMKNNQYSFARHNDKVNVIFADGHSETLSPLGISPELNPDQQMQHLWGK